MKSYGFRWVRALLIGAVLSLLYLWLLSRGYLFDLSFFPTPVLLHAEMVGVIIIGLVYAWFITKMMIVNCTVPRFIFLIVAWIIVLFLSGQQIWLLFKLFQGSMLDISFIGKFLFKASLMPISLAFSPLLLTNAYERYTLSKMYNRMNGGKGGSARWGSALSIAHEHIPLYKYIQALFHKDGIQLDGVLVGRQKFSDDPFRNFVYTKDERNIITAATIGAGKSIGLKSCLATYSSDMVILDVKGELSQASFHRRNGLQTYEGFEPPENIIQIRHSKAFNIAPLGFVDKSANLPIHAYNPLHDFELDDPQADIFIEAILEMVLEESADNKAFEETPKGLLAGFIVHVKSSFPKKYQTLPVIHDLIWKYNPLLEGNERVPDEEFYHDLLHDMLNNPAHGGLAQKAATFLIDGEPRFKANVVSNLQRSIKWLSNEQIRESLSRSDFSFRDIGVEHVKIGKREKQIITTVYVILPDSLLDTYSRYMRIIFAFAINVMKARKIKPKTPTLFVMDEFPRLGGSIKVVKEGFPILRSFKIRLYPLVQDLDQIRKTYPKDYSTMLGTSCKIFFGVMEDFTAEWISKALGQRIIQTYGERMGLFKLFRRRVVGGQSKPLLEPYEVIQKLKPSSSDIIYFPCEGMPIDDIRYAGISIKKKHGDGFKKLHALENTLEW